MIRALRPLIAFLVTASTAFAGTHLAYRLPAGHEFSMTIRTELDPPIVSPIRATVNSRLQVSAAGNPMRITQVIRSQRNGRAAQNLTIRHTLSASGQAGSLSGANMGNADEAFIARSTMTAVPTLPDREVNVGDTWTDSRSFYVPANGSVPNGEIPLQSTYRLQSVSADGSTATISLTTSGSARSIAVRYTGEVTLEVSTGRPLSATINGRVTKSIRFLPAVHMRLSVAMTSTGPRVAGTQLASAATGRASAVGGAVSLLGVR